MPFLGADCLIITISLKRLGIESKYSLNEEIARYFYSVDKIITRLQVAEVTLLISMNISDLLQKSLWQMTGEEFMFLSKPASKNDEAKNQDTPSQSNSEKKYVYGIDGIAEIFGCSLPTASRIKKSGRLNAAIRQIGRKIVVDVELALSLAGHQKSARRWTR